MKTKYGIEKICGHCGNVFLTKPRFIEFCSVPCKNPNNRMGHTPWNKGIELTEEQKAKQNHSGLEKGWGWNKGGKNPAQSKRWTENNPNKDGKMNNLRPKKYVETPFVLYKRECKKATYRTVYRMKKEGRTVITGKRKTDMQVDHIIPYRQGFEQHIDPLIIGSESNIRYILGEENRRKWDTFQPTEVVEQIVADYRRKQGE